MTKTPTPKKAKLRPSLRIIFSILPWAASLSMGAALLYYKQHEIFFLRDEIVGEDLIAETAKKSDGIWKVAPLPSKDRHGTPIQYQILTYSKGMYWDYKSKDVIVSDNAQMTMNEFIERHKFPISQAIPGCEHYIVAGTASENGRYIAERERAKKRAIELSENLQSGLALIEADAKFWVANLGQHVPRCKDDCSEEELAKQRPVVIACARPASSHADIGSGLKNALSHEVALESLSHKHFPSVDDYQDYDFFDLSTASEQAIATRGD